MTPYPFRIVNVFAEARLVGNPLCVFEDARGLDDATMQALALQFNLSGSDQLVIRLASRGAVQRVAPNPDAMLRLASNESRAMAYVFARDQASVLARYFFLQHGALIEDPGTGSACANLGGWLLVTGASLPQRLTVDQGEAVGRRCRLGLEVTIDRRIRVSGCVVELARGTLTL